MFRSCCFYNLLIIGYCSCGLPANRQVSFSFNPQLGVLYKLSVKKINHQRGTYQDKPWQITDSSQIDYSFHLLRYTDSNFLLQLNFDNFSIKTNMFNVNTVAENSSAAELQNQHLLLWNYLLHFANRQSVTAWMNSKGRPLQVNGIDRLLDSVSHMSSIEKRTVRSCLKDYISEPVIMDELNKLFCFLPGKPKSIGQSWVENIMLLAKAPVKWSSDFRMQYQNADTVAIERNSFVSAKQGGETSRTYLKGKLSGDILADYNTGIPYKWNAKIESITSTDNYDIANSQTVTSVITLVKQ